METDWEKKDMRIGWMNCNTSASIIIAARINAGLYKPKDNKEAMKELLDCISIEFAAFQNIDSNKEKPIEKSTGKFYCTDCNKEITEKIKDFSERKYLKPLCMDCQNSYKGM